MAKNHRTDHRSIARVAIFSASSIGSAGLFVLGMIRNGNGAVQKYEALLAADAAGGDVDAALTDLRGYIYAHMNTEIGGPNGIYPPIQLSGTFSRLTAAEEQRVKEANDNLYAEAQSYCEATGNQGFSGRNRLDCINEYIDKNGAKPREIEDAFYKYDFVAPMWSPDLAGFSFIGLIIFGLMTFFSLIGFLRTRHFVCAAN